MIFSVKCRQILTDDIVICLDLIDVSCLEVRYIKYIENVKLIDVFCLENTFKTLKM